MFINIQKYLCCEELHNIKCTKDFNISKSNTKYELCKKIEKEITNFTIHVDHSTVIEEIPDYFVIYHRDTRDMTNSEIRNQWVIMNDLYKKECKDFVLNDYRQRSLKRYNLNEEDIRYCAILNLNGDIYKIDPYEDGEKIYNEIIEALSEDEVIYTIDTNNIIKEN